jgi:hypothetical protein
MDNFVILYDLCAIMLFTLLFSVPQTLKKVVYRISSLSNPFILSLLIIF